MEKYVYFADSKTINNAFINSFVERTLKCCKSITNSRKVFQNKLSKVFYNRCIMCIICSSTHY